MGPRLRALRGEHGVTLSELSTTTGISLSTLSRLESGQRKPTLELLLPLAQAYRVPLDELAGAPETGDPRIHLRPFNRYGRTFVPLTRQMGGGLQAYRMIILREEDMSEQPAHEGYEWLYVLAGRVRLPLQ